MRRLWVSCGGIAVNRILDILAGLLSLAFDLAAIALCGAVLVILYGMYS